jgi:lipopolysaccharide biosynthesis protein
VEFPAHQVPESRETTKSVINPNYTGRVSDYEDTIVHFATRNHPGYKRFRTVMPGWDNTARMQDGGFMLEQSSPGAFQAWVEAAVAETKRDFEGDERLLFVNAWNEWAEGAYLEPDWRFGHTYLEALRNGRMADWLRSDRRG